MQALHHSVVLKRELLRKEKLLVAKSTFVPILTYSHESWVMTERLRSQMRASKMRFELALIFRCDFRISQHRVATSPDQIDFSVDILVM